MTPTPTPTAEALAATPAAAKPVLYVGLIERLMAAGTRLGIAWGDGGVEHFAADLEGNLYKLCRGIEALAAHEAAESASIEEWEQELSAVMPEDFKDWWQNSKREWPAVAAAVIRSQRADRDLGWEMAAKAAPAAEPLTDEQIESIRAQVFSKALQRRDGCDDQTWDHWFARAIERAHGIVASGGEVRHG